MKSMRPHYVTIWSFFFATIGVACMFSVFGCVPYRTPISTTSSHGLRTFSTDQMVSFLHNGERVCVPSGWKALGAKVSFGGAIFPKEKTGVLINESVFEQKTLLKESINGYEVSVLYPKHTDPKEVTLLERMIARSFDAVGSMYAPQKETRPLTIVLTYGVSSTTALYPDPTEKVVYLTRSYKDSRTEELLLHAIAHLYNRFDSRFAGYTAYQSPLSSGDFEELEATWAETAFRTSTTGKRARLAYLYSEYTETTGAYADPEAKKHYIVSPLTMIATEGLLQQLNTGTSIKELLAKTHQGSDINFFDELRTVLPETETARIIQWLNEEELIPYDLLLSGIQSYEIKPDSFYIYRR